MTSEEASKPTFLQNVRRGLVPHSDWDDKDGVLDALLFFRVIFSILIGVVEGLVPLTGFVGFGVYAGVISVIALVYVRVYVGDEECSEAEIVKEGMMPAFGAFLASWIISYSLIQF